MVIMLQLHVANFAACLGRSQAGSLATTSKECMGKLQLAELDRSHWIFVAATFLDMV